MLNMGSLEEVDMDISEGSDMEVSDEERLTQMQVQAKYKHFGTTSAIAPSGHRVLGMSFRSKASFCNGFNSLSTLLTSWIQRHKTSLLGCIQGRRAIV